MATPFEQVGGLLFYRPDCRSAGFFRDWSFCCKLFGEAVDIDHVVVLKPDRPTFEQFVDELQAAGGRLCEGPGLFPEDFCKGCPQVRLDTDLWFHMASVAMANGLVVVACPHRSADQHARLMQVRGENHVHHLAIRTTPHRDMRAAALHWGLEHGFWPRTPDPVEDGVLRQWFLGNPDGQIVELIERHSGLDTFTCHNIEALRQSEIAPRPPASIN
ncbi:hypothetical protein [Gloeobacter violaceus]|nr:hypothetical protein [Gloeobacter violaceus]